MALQNNPNLYTAGAVTVDTSGPMNFYIGLLGKEHAKREALEKYYSSLPGTINSAGMRDVDRLPFMKALEDAGAFWRQNKDKIINPNMDGGVSQLQYEKMFRAAQMIPESSKVAAKQELELAKLRGNKELAHIWDDPDTFAEIQKSGLSVADPNYKAFNIADKIVPPKPIQQEDIASLNKLLTDKLQFSEKFVRSEKLPGTMQLKNVYSKEYDAGSLQKMASAAEGIYYSDPRWKAAANKQYKDILETNTQRAIELNQVYKSLTGKDAQNPVDFFVAQAVESNTSKSTREEIVEDKEETRKEALKNQMKLAAYNSQLNLSEKKQYKQWLVENGYDKDKAGEEDAVMDDYITKLVKPAESKGELPPAPEGFVNGHEINLDPTVAKALSRQNPTDGKSYEPNKLLYNPKTKEFTPVFYEYGENGVVKKGDAPAVDETLSKPISIDQFKFALGSRTLGKTQIVKEMSGGKKKKTKQKESSSDFPDTADDL